MSAVGHVIGNDASAVKEAAVTYGKISYEHFKEGDIETRSRMLTNVVGGVTLFAVPVSKVGQVSKIAKAEKALSTTNKIEKTASFSKTAQGILANEGGYLRLGSAGKSAKVANAGTGGVVKKANSWNEFQKATKGQFATRAEASAAYKKLLAEESPWPKGYVPQRSILKPGTRFEMALETGQPANRPGAFGTFDNISDTNFVRYDLAVKTAFKSDIDRVATYEVIKELPTNLGPVGPQIDLITGHYLPGGKSQLEMLVPKTERMNYIKNVGERKIHK